MRMPSRSLFAILLLGACARVPAVNPLGQDLAGQQREARLQGILDEAVERGLPAVSARIESGSWTWSGVAVSAEYGQYNAWAWSAGALNSNTEDLAVFFNAVRSGSVLSPESTQVVRGHSTFVDTTLQLSRFSQAGGWDGIQASCDEIGDDLVVVLLMNGTGIDDVSSRAVLAALHEQANR